MSLVRGIQNIRRLSSGPIKYGVWSNFTARPESLRLDDSESRKNLFEGIDPLVGPASRRRKYPHANGYYSPSFIDETFQKSYMYLENESEKLYSEVDELRKNAEETKDENTLQKINAKIEKLISQAEVQNPEVQYIFENFPEKVDTSQPVYRHLLKEKWKSYDLMLLMQRLEQLHVIPDTLPTLDPKVEVKVKFDHNADPVFAKWIIPGEILPSFAVSQPPTIQIQDFSPSTAEKLYTILLVNPDTPDLKSNSFSTQLHYGLCNVTLSNTKNVFIPAQAFFDGGNFTFRDYIPLLPEKNAQLQRACLWVFTQEGPLDIELNSVKSEEFDIRNFVEKHNLLAVGAHVWRQGFDRSVNEIRSLYGFDKGRVFHRVRRAYPLTDHDS